MAKAKVAVTIDQRLLREVDGWVAAGEFPNRSRALEEALHELERVRIRSRNLLHELAKLDPDEERALTEESLVADRAWPEY